MVRWPSGQAEFGTYAKVTQVTEWWHAATAAHAGGEAWPVAEAA